MANAYVVKLMEEVIDAFEHKAQKRSGTVGLVLQASDVDPIEQKLVTSVTSVMPVTSLTPLTTTMTADTTKNREGACS